MMVMMISEVDLEVEDMVVAAAWGAVEVGNLPECEFFLNLFHYITRLALFNCRP